MCQQEIIIKAAGAEGEFLTINVEQLLCRNPGGNNHLKISAIWDIDTKPNRVNKKPPVLIVHLRVWVDQVLKGASGWLLWLPATEAGGFFIAAPLHGRRSLSESQLKLVASRFQEDLPVAVTSAPPSGAIY